MINNTTALSTDNSMNIAVSKIVGLQSRNHTIASWPTSILNVYLVLSVVCHGFILSFYRQCLLTVRLGKEVLMLDTSDIFVFFWWHAGHPGSFRNREKVYLKERQAEDERKADERAKMEFQMEMETFKNASMLSHTEKEKLKQLQSVGWLYQRPPGLPSEPQDTAGESEPTGAGGPSHSMKKGQEHTSNTGEGQPAVQQKDATKQPKGNYIAQVVGGYKAFTKLQRENLELNSQKFPVYSGRSPPRGGLDPSADNQQFVISTMDSEEEEEVFRRAMLPEKERRRSDRIARREARRYRKESQKRKVEEAKAFLKAVGMLKDDSPETSCTIDDENKEQEGSARSSPKVKKRKKE